MRREGEVAVSRAGTDTAALGFEHAFEQSGVYDVSCDAHSGMSAQIIAAASPYVVFADSNARFEIRHVVSGTYAVIVYSVPPL